MKMDGYFSRAAALSVALVNQGFSQRRYSDAVSWKICSGMFVARGSVGFCARE